MLQLHSKVKTTTAFICTLGMSFLTATLIAAVSFMMNDTGSALRNNGVNLRLPSIYTPLLILLASFSVLKIIAVVIWFTKPSDIEKRRNLAAKWLVIIGGIPTFLGILFLNYFIVAQFNEGLAVIIACSVEGVAVTFGGVIAWSYIVRQHLFCHAFNVVLPSKETSYDKDNDPWLRNRND